MIRMRWFSVAALAGLAAPSVGFSQDASLTPEQILQVVRVEAITIPTPGEFFVAIDKQGSPQWSQLVRAATPAATASRAQIAMALGTLVADGYIAVEAQDSQGVKNIGKEIINLAKKLNVSQSVLGRGNSINDFAQANNWSALREELEATQNEVKLDMADQKDTNLITLVTIGAWLRGTEIASGLVEKAYTPESARLLRQPAIITYLLDQVASLPASLQEEKLIKEIRSTLESAKAYVQADTPSEQNIKDLHASVAKAVNDIVTKGVQQ